jgi:hypothetical protein
VSVQRYYDKYHNKGCEIVFSEREQGIVANRAVINLSPRSRGFSPLILVNEKCLKFSDPIGTYERRIVD